VGAEETFAQTCTASRSLPPSSTASSSACWERCERAKVGGGRTVTLKVKFADFTQVTRSRTGPGITGRDEVRHAGLALLQGVCPVAKGVRLLGLTLSGLDDHDQPGGAEQLSFKLAL
jgi:DNA polymerase IV